MNLCVSNLTVCNISEIILFSVFLQKYCLVYYYKLKSSQNSTFCWLASFNSIPTKFIYGLFHKDSNIRLNTSLKVGNRLDI